MIKTSDNGEGVEYEKVLDEIKESETVIKTMIKNGEVFEVSKGKLKLVQKNKGVTNTSKNAAINKINTAMRIKSEVSKSIFSKLLVPNSFLTTDTEIIPPARPAIT